MAQGIDLIRDTEIERTLKGYEDPIATAAGLDPAAIHIYIVNDSSINAFVAEGQNIFINTGLFLQLKTPNQIIGVMAHETGHIAGGHLVRDTSAMSKASVPMLIGMAVGVAAMVAGAGQAGMGAIALGEQAAMSQFFAFSRVQEATADQMGQRFLRATHQSGEGMVEVFQKMANMQALEGHVEFATTHPVDRERIDLMQREVDASPYRDVKDSPEAVHEFHMIQAKLFGFLSKPENVLIRYPITDKSEEARYARAIAYFQKPELKLALDEIGSLIKDEPKNPYFYEVQGQIYVSMAQPEKGVLAYQKAVNAMPDAPLLRTLLATAQLATEKPALAKPALDNLKVSLQQDPDDSFGWYETAAAYSALNNQPMADLSTAEMYYYAGAMPKAVVFAKRAQRGLTEGSMDWERANDIVSVASTQARR
ncbi:MAG TPA: M48 family metalloprotease [Rhizomicrobium sp.]|nr:M48 family metalloprotease [Rhizomicrobium sp.]